MVKTIGIVSLSAGTLGESFVAHELELGLRRLKDYGVKVKFMDHALKGIAYLKDHPEKRAADLLQAFRDPEVDMILCAIGGEDTYRLLPYLFDHDELKNAIQEKIFLGFSDTTVNHFMLHKLGLKTFYGQSFLADVCELGAEMLPYSKRYFEELLTTGRISKITPSDTWYEGRCDFGIEQLGVELTAHPDHGFVLLQGRSVFSGEILGGCIDTIFDFFDTTRHTDMMSQCAKYGLFPSVEEWKGKILLLESSEEKMSPDKYRKAIRYLKAAGVFSVINGVLVGKPMDKTYDAEYRKVLAEELGDMQIPIVCNVNIGHAQPRCIIPFGVMAEVNADLGTITFAE